MEATVKIPYNPREALPHESVDRAAWITAHGVLPESAEAEITLPVITWAEIGAEVCDDGSVRVGRSTYHYTAPLHDRIVRELLARTLAAGSPCTTFDARPLAAAIRGEQAAEAARKRAEREADVRQHAEEERRKQEVIADVIERYNRGEQVPLLDDGDLVAGNWYLQRTDARVREETQRRDAAKAAAKAEQLRVRAAAIRAWAEQAPAELHAVERLGAGVLPEEEALEGILDVALAAVTAPEYERMEGGCDECDAEVNRYTTTDAPEVSARQWEVFQEIQRQAGGDAEVIVRLHIGHLPCEHDNQVRYGALVRIAWHGITVSREYALPDAE